MFRIDKKKVFLLYQFYLFEGTQINKIKIDKEEKERFFWLTECHKNEKYLRALISKRLKSGWTFFRLPPLERAILIFSTYELLFGRNSNYPKLIIDQVINFSKAYLEEGKYKYINKVLDLIIKNKDNNYW